VLPSAPQESDDKLIYDMDSKSTRNQSEEVSPSAVKRKRQISEEETEDAVNSILAKRRRDASSAEKTPNLDDSGYQGEPDDEVFHPAFRGTTNNGAMEVDQITSLVSIFSFGQQLFSGSEQVQESGQGIPKCKTTKDKDNEDDSDSDSDTSSDSGHSSDDHENKEEESELTELTTRTEIPDTRCSSEVKEKDLELSALSPSAVAAAV